MNTLLLLTLTIASEPANERLARLQADLAAVKLKTSDYRPTVFDSIMDIDADAAGVLKQLPYVAGVKVSKSKRKPTRRIIHILDWHFVPRDNYAVDLANARGGKPAPDDEVDAEHAVHVAEVALVQAEQFAAMRVLVKIHGLRAVSVEGLTPEDMEVLPIRFAANRALGKRLEKLAPTRDELSPESLQGLDELVAHNRAESLRLGAAGKLMEERSLRQILPLDDKETLDAAMPFEQDGKLFFNDGAPEAREKAIVKRLLEPRNRVIVLADGPVKMVMKPLAPPVAVIVLGGGHDLGPVIAEESGAAEYVRVEVRSYRAVASDTRRHVQ